MNTNERDAFLCQDYQEGMEINELARSYGLSERRVSQILRANNIVRRPRVAADKKPLSAEHARIGLHLHKYRFERNLDPHTAATELGWSVIKLRKVEKGTTEVELLDLLDIAAYTEVNIGKLLEKTNG